jgi:hypothetical protein
MNIKIQKRIHLKELQLMKSLEKSVGKPIKIEVL